MPPAPAPFTGHHSATDHDTVNRELSQGNLAATEKRWAIPAHTRAAANRFRRLALTPLRCPRGAAVPGRLPTRRTRRLACTAVLGGLPANSIGSGRNLLP